MSDQPGRGVLSSPGSEFRGKLGGRIARSEPDRGLLGDVVRRDATPSPFHLLAKPTGAACNLDCAYCFFLSKDMLYPGGRFRMTDEVLQEYLRQLFEAHAGLPEVLIAWQGGEPTLMGLDFFRRSVEIAKRHQRTGQRVVYTIQTNGTLIDEEWAAFFKEHAFLVGVSIDGPRDVHDTYRVTRGGRGSFEKVMRGLGHLRDAGVEWNALTTVHDANAARGREIYRFLRDDCDARFVQLIPIVERVAGALEDGSVPWSSWRDRPLYKQEGNVVTARSVSGEQYGRFLIDVFEEWVRRDVGEVFVRTFDVALANWAGVSPDHCVHSETCGRGLALGHTGDLFSCDHFVQPEFLLGNMRERTLAEMVGSARQQRFGRDKRDALPRYCLDCDVRFACHGGCPKDRFVSTPDGEPGLNFLCAGYRTFFRHIERPMQTMVDLLHSGKAPAEIVGRYAAEDRRRGRNEHCPCGSGRKWKRCHGGEHAELRTST